MVETVAVGFSSITSARMGMTTSWTLLAAARMTTAIIGQRCLAAHRQHRHGQRAWPGTPCCRCSSDRGLELLRRRSAWLQEGQYSLACAGVRLHRSASDPPRIRSRSGQIDPLAPLTSRSISGPPKRKCQSSGSSGSRPWADTRQRCIQEANFRDASGCPLRRRSPPCFRCRG